MKRRNFLKYVGLGGLGLMASKLIPLHAQTTATPAATATATATPAYLKGWTVGTPYPYLTGGTAKMQGNYPNPFTDLTPDCVATCQMTEGPCYADVNLIRQDVSEGLAGLPMRLLFRVVDVATCQPIENVSVEIWHADFDGVYSGETPAAMCYGDQPEAVNAAWMRGIQFTDADGIASFDTCYPGWYSSRAPHIHVRFGLDEQELLISQVFFPDEMSAFVYSTHPDYDHRPDYDTPNSEDNIIDEDHLESYLLHVADAEDGAILGYITIGLSTESGASVCTLGGTAPTNGSGGMPPQGSTPPNG